MSRRMSVALVAAGALAALFVTAGVAFATHPFPSLAETGTTAGTSFRVPLAPSYKPCRASDQGGSPNSTHSGVPGDACGHTGAANLVSAVVKPGPSQIAWLQLSLKNPNTSSVDVVITSSSTDVRCKVANAGAGCPAVNADYNPNPAGGPYTSPGSGHSTPPSPACTSAASCFGARDMTLTAEVPLQQLSGANAGMPVNPGAATEHRTVADRAFHVTDHYSARQTAAPCNTQGSPPPSCLATTQDEPFPTPVVCTPSGSATATPGSTCGVNTTANSLVPGAVVNGKRGVLEVGQIQIYDAGLNGTANFLTTAGDDKIASRQGLTIP